MQKRGLTTEQQGNNSYIRDTSISLKTYRVDFIIYVVLMASYSSSLHMANLNSRTSVSSAIYLSFVILGILG